MEQFRSKYGLQGAVGFISCQDTSSGFFLSIIPTLLNMELKINSANNSTELRIFYCLVKKNLS